MNIFMSGQKLPGKFDIYAFLWLIGSLKYNEDQKILIHKEIIFKASIMGHSKYFCSMFICKNEVPFRFLKIVKSQKIRQKCQRNIFVTIAFDYLSNFCLPNSHYKNISKLCVTGTFLLLGLDTQSCSILLLTFKTKFLLTAEGFCILYLLKIT